MPQMIPFGRRGGRSSGRLCEGRAYNRMRPHLEDMRWIRAVTQEGLSDILHCARSFTSNVLSSRGTSGVRPSVVVLRLDERADISPIF
eukprot:scaffold1990_cov350-Prasinococcus_capsulatus_cf.AAC.5